MIFHLVDRPSWEAALALGEHRPPSLRDQGFIHFSTEDQVLATANRFFAGQSELVMLLIDDSKLEGLLKYEAGEPGQVFPHFYGPLPVSAVSAVIRVRPDADGVFRTLPPLPTDTTEEEEEPPKPETPDE